MPSKIRVHELAKELGLTNKETLDLSVALGIAVKTHSSSMEDSQADRVRRKAEREGLVRAVQPAEPAKVHRPTPPRAETRPIIAKPSLPPVPPALQPTVAAKPRVASTPSATVPSAPKPLVVASADILLVLVDASRLPYVKAAGFAAIRKLLGTRTKVCIITLGVGGEVLVPGQPADDVGDVYWPSKLGRPNHDDTVRVIDALSEVSLLSGLKKPTVMVVDLVYWQAFGELRSALEDFGNTTLLGGKALGIKQTEEQKDLRSDAQRMLRQGPEARPPHVESRRATVAQPVSPHPPRMAPKPPPPPNPRVVRPLPPRPPVQAKPPIPSTPRVAASPASPTRPTVPWQPPPPPPPRSQQSPVGPQTGTGSNYSFQWPTPQPPKRSGLAIWSLVATLWCGIGSILALVLAAVALNQIDKSNGQRTGRNYAICAIVIALAELTILFLVSLGTA